MNQAEPYPFDFRNAGTTDEVVRVLKEWLHKTADTFLDSWEAVSDSIVSLDCRGVLSRTFEEGVQSVPMASVGFGLLIGESPIHTLACIPIKDLVALIGAIFGTEVEDVEDHKLTSIEVSLCEMVYETLCSALSEAWIGKEKLEIKISDFEDPPQFSRLIPVKELVLCTQVQLRVTDTIANLTWLIPRQELEALIEATTGASLKRVVNHPKDILQQVTIELTGLLGANQMTMRSLSELEVGDLMILNQKIDQPVSVYVDNHKFYEGWPGKVGRRQGIEIAKVI